jgi:hypothetical protein
MGAAVVAVAVVDNGRDCIRISTYHDKDRGQKEQRKKQSRYSRCGCTETAGQNDQMRWIRWVFRLGLQERLVQLVYLEKLVCRLCSILLGEVTYDYRPPSSTCRRVACCA